MSTINAPHSAGDSVGIRTYPDSAKVRVNLGPSGISECIIRDSMLILHLYRKDFNYDTMTFDMNAMT